MKKLINGSIIMNAKKKVVSNNFLNRRKVVMNDNKQIVLKSKLKNIRKSRNVTQQQLSFATGITEKTIGRIECNAAIPKIDTAMRLAKYFDMTVEDLYE